MFFLKSSPGRTAIVDGKEYLFFSGYSYLGMGHVPEFIELVKEGIDKYGILHPSSRISNTQLSIYREFEQLLSSITKQEETVCFSSGYLAGRAIADTLINDSVSCYVLLNTHPALNVGIKPFEGTEEELTRTINNTLAPDIVLLCDSVNPLQASITDFLFLNNISANKSITCIIDDSHGIGVIGKDGSGICSLLPQLKNVDYVISYSLSKAFHITGGAINCNGDIAKKLRRSPYYSGSTAISPSLVYTFLHGQELYKSQLEKLKKNIAFFINLIKDQTPLHFHRELPVFILDDRFDDDYLKKQNIIISSFSYPDPTGHKVNRIVLNALHTEEDLTNASTIFYR